YFYSSEEKKDLITRVKNSADAPLPNAQSVMIENLLQFYYYTGKNTYLEMAKRTLENIYPTAIKNPIGYGTFFTSIQWYLYGSTDIVAISKEINDSIVLKDKILNIHIPRLHFISSNSKNLNLPLLKDKKVAENGKSYYLCHHFSCQNPITDGEEFYELIKQVVS
ncbi:MAG: hypothetical protein GY870_20155, partial [archaeon]|nr:hypothetical protein [archaeon]